MWANQSQIDPRDLRRPLVNTEAGPSATQSRTTLGFRSALTFWTERFNSAVLSKQRVLIGQGLAWRVRDIPSINNFSDVEFSVFSQWGDDGIIQWLIHRIPGLSETFVEFGVEGYQEANTRFCSSTTTGAAWSWTARG